MKKPNLRNLKKIDDYAPMINNPVAAEFASLWDKLEKPEIIKSPDDSVSHLKDLSSMQCEAFSVMCLDGAHHVKKVAHISRGTYNKCIVDPKIVFRFAIINRAVSIIVAHNHPSGSLKPSTEDIALTERLIEGAKSLNINLLDHVIISYAGYRSMLEHGDVSF